MSLPPNRLCLKGHKARVLQQCALGLFVLTAFAVQSAASPPSLVANTDLVSLSKSGRNPTFDQILDARFAPPPDGQFQAYKHWAEHTSTEERAPWYKPNGTDLDGKPAFIILEPCGSLESRALPRAMITASEKATDRAAAQRIWKEVERAYAAEPIIEQKEVAATRDKKFPTPLGAELAIRVARDQAWRTAQFQRKHDAITAEAITWRFGAEECRVDSDNLTWLRKVVAAGEWPLRSRDGKGAADAAWLLAQHADDDRAFQKKVLALIEPLVARHEASGKSYALLFDRVAIGENRAQRYGSQFTIKDGCLTALNIENPSRVDERRARVGLPTLSSYAKQLSTVYHIPICGSLLEGVR